MCATEGAHVDERVLEAQRWVNATYRTVAGYTPAPENGQTGWPTMYALTRALQHELGLTTLSGTYGAGVYPTWCQVLISTGDPDRPGAACDGITEITDARAAGDVTCDKGYADAVRAHQAALGFGFDAGTVIYFAVDYDATGDQIASNVVPYFHGVVAGLGDHGDHYAHGVYGSRNVCTPVTSSTSARWSFVSGMSYGFSGNMGFPLPVNWAFNQIETLTLGDGDARIEIDKDVWRTGTDPGVAVLS